MLEHQNERVTTADCCRLKATIRSWMKSIYRKLDATNRHQAVTRARELGLLER
jgi:DNA-binding NarL/FixJ family response regulator